MLRVALVMALTLAGAGLAWAPAGAAAPPWEPDTNARGNLSFFDAGGNVISSGSLSTLLAFVATTAPPRAGDNIATLFGAVATVGENPGIWPAEQMSGATNNPDAIAPSPLNTTPDAVFDSASGEETIAQLVTDLPVPAADAGTAYNNVYQIRMTTSSAANGLDVEYWETDITVDTAAGTWSQLYPTPSMAVNSHTALSVSPPSPQGLGTTLTLMVAVTPSTATGTVQFADGGAALGSPVAVSSGSAAFSTSALPAGSHSLSAAFTPGSPAQFNPSTSNTVPYTINPAGSAPQVSTTVLPGGAVGAAYSATLSATGGSAPYSWSIPTGSLPAGLTLTASSGVIGGTPTTAGAFSFTVQVTDSSSPAPKSASAPLGITINAPVSISTASLPGGVDQVAYSATLAASEIGRAHV